MLRKSITLLVLSAFLLAGSVWALSPKVPIRNLPEIGGSNDVNGAVPYVMTHFRDAGTLDSVGEAYYAGTTWYDYQHNGSSGKMITVDSTGIIQVVWMNGLDAAFSTRYVYFNWWDPGTDSFMTNPTGGTAVNSSIRAGYSSQALGYGGFAYPGYHEITAGSNAFACASIDYSPHAGAFSTTEPGHLSANNIPTQLIWPKIAVDGQNKIHMVSTESPPTSGNPGYHNWQKVGYSRGNPVFDDQGHGSDIIWDTTDTQTNKQIKLMDTVVVIAADIAASKHSNRVVIAYSRPRPLYNGRPVDSTNQYDNDLAIKVSDDGGDTWGPAQIITNFQEADHDCASHDTVACNRDTNRVYTDCNVIFDEQDNIHVVFTTANYYTLNGTISAVFSIVWHWDEMNNEFTPIYNGTIDSLLDTHTTIGFPTPGCGAWQRMAQRPNLAIDATTGYLYCSFNVYDSLRVSSAGYPQGDAFVCVSTDGGRIWSQAINVTNADHEEGATAGNCRSIRDITVAKNISYTNDQGYLNMEYILDLDAGGVIQTPPEGVATLNPVVYRRIPINEIPLRPIQNPFWPICRFDSTGMPGRVNPLDTSVVIDASHGRDLNPVSFKLYQNYPNPFNPTTNIQFDLARDARVSLKVYNVLGEEVATLYNNEMLGAGARTAYFDGSNLASGVYVYRIEVGNVKASRKMVLMK